MIINIKKIYIKKKRVKECKVGLPVGDSQFGSLVTDRGWRFHC